MTPTTLLALAAVYIVWGSTYFVMRVAFVELPPLMASGLRFVLAGGALFVGLRLRGAPWPTRKQWLLAWPVGVLMFVCGNGIVAITGRYIASGVVAVVAATMPLWAAALGRFWGEKNTVRELAALFLGFLGVVVLSSGADLQANPAMTALLFFAPIGWAIGSMLARRWPMAPGLMSAAAQMLTGGATMLALGALRGEVWPQRVSTGVGIGFAYLVLIGSLATFSAYSYLLRKVRPALAMSYAYVNPVLAVIIGNVFGAEAILPQSIVATVLIVIAVMLAIRR